MPSEYTDWVGKAFGWARVNWPSLIIPGDCVPFGTGSSFRAWLLVKGISPLVVILVAVIGTTAVESARLGWSRKHIYKGVLRALPLALFISFCFVPSVSMSIFQSWLCVEYQFDGRDEDSVTSHSFLRSDLSIRCSSDGVSDPEYDTITSIAFALIWVWPVGMVLLYVAALLPCRRSIRAHIQTPLTHATTFLTRDFNPEYFWWELIELLRRTVLIGWVLFFPAEKTFLRLVAGLLVSITSLTLLLSVHPYRRREDNVLAAGCQLTLIFSFIGGSYTRLFHEFELVTSPAIVRRIMAFYSTRVIGLPLITIALAMMVLMLGLMVALIRHEGSQPLIRHVTTAAPPLLSLKKMYKWALFLSHTWASAQE